MTATAETKILLDPVDFMALHLSALANGGIGRGNWYVNSNWECPFCVEGHALWLDGQNVYGTDTNEMNLDSPMIDRLKIAARPVLDEVSEDRMWEANDAAFREAGLDNDTRLPFLKYVKLLNIDINEGGN